MTVPTASTAAVSVLATAAVVVVTYRWWRGRSGDVPASRRASVLAAATTVLALPALALTLAGAPPVLMTWVLLVPPAWVAVGVSSVVEQRQARARDLALGAPRRPVLWHPWMVGALVAAALFACMLGALVAVFAVHGDVGTSLVMAAAGSVVCGSAVLAWTQSVRRSLARGHGPTHVVVDLEKIPRRKPLAVGAFAAGLVAVVAGVACAARLELGLGTVSDALLIFASTPGWVLVALAWLIAQPQRPVIGEDLAD